MSRTRRGRWRWREGAAALCLSLVSNLANAEERDLFSGVDIPQSIETSAAEDDVAAIQRGIVRMDFGQLDAARKEVLAGGSSHLALNLFHGLSFRAVVERTAPTSSGYSLSGRLEGVPFGTMALVVNGRIVIGKVRTLDAVYTIRSMGPGTYVIERTGPTEFVEGAPLKPVEPSSAVDPQTDAGSVEEDDGFEIDVLVAWTPTVRRDAGGTRNIEAAIDLAVLEANDAYAASGAAQRIRLAGAVEVNHEDTGNLTTDLPRLANSSDGHMDEIHALRDSYAADLVHLAASGLCGGGGIEGLAYAMENVSAGFESSAFSASVFCDLVNLQATARRGLSSRLFAHELGHNMGLQHDRAARFITLNEPYPYSHGYVNQRAFDEGAAIESRWRTIMAYDTQCRAAGLRCPSILRFSNPNQRYPPPDGDPLGIPGDDPSEESDGPADAVRSLENTRRIVANFRPSASRCTYRLSQDSVTMAASGGEFSIDVETGQECAYAARSHDAFLSVASGESGTGSGSVRYRVEANDGDARVGALSVAGETLVVRQSGAHAYAGVCDRTPQIRDAIVAWAGKACGLVTEFDLSEIPYLLLANRHIGTLRADDLAGLSSLRTLDLFFNGLAAIPPELGRLTRLERLNLSGNFIAAIPPELGDLANLKRLRLRGNKLTGIPPELGRLANLEHLDISLNALEGAIPEALSGLGELHSLYLHLNRLTGGVPAWLGGLTNLGFLDLSDNRLTGAIPAELGGLSGLARLDLANNSLTGSIPPELESIDNLQNLDLSGNRLSGSIPVEFGRLNRLKGLNLGDNQLTGTIPMELGGAQRLADLTLHSNQLTGNIPSELGSLPCMQLLRLHSNALTGDIPAELGSLRYLTELSLHSNELTGGLPPELGRLSNLRSLRLHENGFAGAIPEEFGDLTNLVELWLHGNELTGSIPPALNRLRKLRELLLQDNQLTGPIPSALGLLEHLEALRLSDNRLTGAIPGSLTDLTNLNHLSLGGNRLTGCVPGALHDIDRNDLHRLGLPICATRVANLVIESLPLDGRAYGSGERIVVSVRFDNEVTISGFPQLVLTIGPEVRVAAFAGNRGGGQLAFHYVVGMADRDPDGVSIAPEALWLNGGEIRDGDGERALPFLGAHAIANHPSHRVRGALRELVSDQETEAGGDTLTLDLSRYFDVPEGGTLTYGTPVSSDSTVVTAIVEDGLLKIMPREEGVATITVTATYDGGVTVTLSFRVTVMPMVRGLRPWLMGILSEQAAGEAEDDSSQ